MATYKPLYAAEADVVLNPDNLGIGNARKSDAVDNTSTLYSDILIGTKVKTTNNTLGTGPVIRIFIAPLITGTNYTDDVTAGDAGYTLLGSRNIKLLDVIRVTAQNVTYYSSLKSVAALFGGVLPPKFVVIFDNQTGVILAGSAGARVENKCVMVGVNYQSA